MPSSYSYIDYLYRPFSTVSLSQPEPVEIKPSESVILGTDHLNFQKPEDFQAPVESAILQAQRPLALSSNELVSVNGQLGAWINKNENENWRGELPLSAYPINDDPQPEVIRKRTDQHLVYEQEVAIRYLRPPTPPPPGEIILKELESVLPPVAPPLVIRQQPPRPETPAPVVIREAPPAPPQPIAPKIVTIPGKRLPPPPRKVVIERLPQLPQKPQSVIIERWLPYKEPARKVVFARNTVPDPVVPKPKNTIIQWETPQVYVKKEYRDLGVIRANPYEYVERYGETLKAPYELPNFVKEIQAPAGVVLAAQHQPSSIPQLIGDIDKLSLIDLDREGLSEYKQYLNTYRPVSPQRIEAPTPKPSFDTTFLNLFLANSFAALDSNGDFKISLAEATQLFSQLNNSVGLNASHGDIKAFVDSFDRNQDGFIDFNEFKKGVIRKFVAHEHELSYSNDFIQRIASQRSVAQQSASRQASNANIAQSSSRINVAASSHSLAQAASSANVAAPSGSRPTSRAQSTSQEVAAERAPSQPASRHASALNVAASHHSLAQQVEERTPVPSRSGSRAPSVAEERVPSRHVSALNVAASHHSLAPAQSHYSIAQAQSHHSLAPAQSHHSIAPAASSAYIAAPVASRPTSRAPSTSQEAVAERAPSQAASRHASVLNVAASHHSLAPAQSHYSIAPAQSHHSIAQAPSHHSLAPAASSVNVAQPSSRPASRVQSTSQYIAELLAERAASLAAFPPAPEQQQASSKPASRAPSQPASRHQSTSHYVSQTFEQRAPSQPASRHVSTANVAAAEQPASGSRPVSRAQSTSQYVSEIVFEPASSQPVSRQASNVNVAAADDRTPVASQPGSRVQSVQNLNQQ